VDLVEGQRTHVDVLVVVPPPPVAGVPVRLFSL